MFGLGALALFDEPEDTRMIIDEICRHQRILSPGGPLAVAQVVEKLVCYLLSRDMVCVLLYEEG